MKKLLLFSMALFALNSCSSDDSGQSTTSEDVKLKSISSETSITEIYYSGNQLNYIETERFGEGIFKTVYIYENGVIVGQKDYENGIYKANEDNTYIYDNGNIIKASGVEDGILFLHEYTYNSSNQMTVDAQYNDGVYCCSSIYEYDSSGNVNYGSGYYDNKKNPIYYVFPEAFNKIKKTSKNNAVDSGKYIYEYNESGFPTKKKTKDENGSIIKTELFQYY